MAVDAVHAEVLLLGPVVAHLPGRAPDRLPAKERALLARLALDVNRVVSVERLIDDLWGDSPTRAARNTLQVYVSHLRRRLGAHMIDSSGAGYRLVLSDAAAIDANRFADLVRAGSVAAAAARSTDAVSALTEALDLWRGEPLADIADYEFARVASANWTELRADATQVLAEVELSRGNSDRVVAEFGPLVAAFPFRERLRAAVMTALYREGRAADALDMYRELQVLLRDELGLDPGPSLQALQKAILADDPALVAAAPQSQRCLDAMPLPAPATPLVGRTNETAEVARLLGRPGVRLVTMLGLGGTGKTRLAVEVVRNPPARFAGAIVWASLVGFDDPVRVLPAVGAALRLQTEPIDIVRIASAVDGGPALLVLDNAEHLLPGLARVVADLIAGCPELSLLVTSRTALHVDGEHRFLLGPLPVPAQDADPQECEVSPAVQLFAERARQVRPGFALVPGNVDAVAKICIRLDGLPLALELVAARAGLLEPAAMLARLESRLGWHTSRQVDSHERHRSLRATVDWSYRLLTPQASWLFASLGVFRGSFTLSAAERLSDVFAVANGSVEAIETGDATVADAFQELLDASMIAPRGGGRFLMLGIVAEYAMERLAESGIEQQIRDAHCQLFREDAMQRCPGPPMGPRNSAEFDWYVAERDNLRAATLWALHCGNTAGFAVLATRGCVDTANPGERPLVSQWLQLIAQDPDAGMRRAEAEFMLAYVPASRGSVVEGIGHLNRALQFLGDGTDDPDLFAAVLAERSLLAHFGGRAADARRDAQRAIVAVERTSNPRMLAPVLVGLCAGLMDDPPAAIPVLLRARHAAAAVGDEGPLCSALMSLAELALTAGEADTALRRCTEAMQLEFMSRSLPMRGAVLNIMAGALLLTGDLARAGTALQEGMRSAARFDDAPLVAEATLFGAAMAAARGDLSGAATLLGSHDAAYHRLGEQRVDSSVTIYNSFLADLDLDMDSVEFQACIERGSRLTTRELIDWLANDRPPAFAYSNPNESHVARVRP